MKLHEKAKELGVKAKDLIKYLNDAGFDIRSPNQELSDNEITASNNLLSSPESKHFDNEALEITNNSLAISLDKDTNTLKLMRLGLSKDNQVVTSSVMQEKKFPSTVQMFAEAEYILAQIELGTLK